MTKAFHSLLFFLMLLCFGSTQVFAQGVQGTMTDPRDGQIYKTVTINGKTWMAENLRYETANSVIYLASEFEYWVKEEEYTPKKLGYLYTWEEAKRACPEGWRLPSTKDWLHIGIVQGATYGDSDKYREIGTNPQIELANYNNLIEGGKSGFNAVLGGWQGDITQFNAQPIFLKVGDEGQYWSSDNDGRDNNGKLLPIYAYFGKVFRETQLRTDSPNHEPKSLRNSCRCIQDITSTIALKTFNGHYLVAENGGGGALNADRTERKNWETFTMIELGNNKVALKTHNGHYVVAEKGGGGALNANRTERKNYETFTKVDLGDNKIALKTHNGHYVVAEKGGGGAVNADRTERKNWETFTVVRVNK